MTANNEFTDGRLDNLAHIKLLRYITVLTDRGNGEVEAECEQCGKVFALKLTPIEPFATARTLPCGCTMEINQLEQDCAQMLTNTQVRIIGQTMSPDRHRRALCWCERDKNYFRARFESLKNGRVRSCGCLRDAQSKVNLSQTGKYSCVMGTHLGAIRRTDDTPIASNTSGYPGVRYDASRRKWVAELEFQAKTYLRRYNTKSEAIRCRRELKRIHDEFLQWWDALTGDERVAACAQYDGEQDAAWMLLRKELDETFHNNRRSNHAITTPLGQIDTIDASI